MIFSGSPWSAYDDEAPPHRPERSTTAACRFWASATACSSRRICSAAGGPRGLARVRPRAHRGRRATTHLFDGLGFRDGRLDEPRRPRREAARGLRRHRAHSTARPTRRCATESKPIYGVQFHPEVTHTPRGTGDPAATSSSASASARGGRLDGCAPSSTRAVEKIRAQVGETERVICGLSGGVDSTPSPRCSSTRRSATG